MPDLSRRNRKGVPALLKSVERTVESFLFSLVQEKATVFEIGVFGSGKYHTKAR